MQANAFRSRGSHVRPAGTAASQLGLQWSKYIGPGGVVTWCQPDSAAIWFQRALSIASNPDVDKMAWGDQLAAVEAVWQALSFGYQAANVPPYSDPEFRSIFYSYTGPCVPSQQANAADMETIGKLYASGLINAPSLASFENPTVPRTYMKPILSNRFMDLWRQWRGSPIDENHTLCGMMVRMSLANDGSFVEQCALPTGLSDPAHGPQSGWSCDFTSISSGCANARTGLQNCAVYDWNSVAWNESPMIDWTAAGAVCRVSLVSPPLAWSMEMAAAIAQSCVNRGVFGMIDQAMANAMRLNTLTAARLNVGQPELQAIVATLTSSGALESSAAFQRYMQQHQNEFRAENTTASTLGYAGLMWQLFITFAQNEPGAVGCQTDAFGRCFPTFEPLWIYPGTNGGAPFKVYVQPPPGYTGETHAVIDASTMNQGGGSVVPIVVGGGLLAALAWMFLK